MKHLICIFFIALIAGSYVACTPSDCDPQDASCNPLLGYLLFSYFQSVQTIVATGQNGIVAVSEDNGHNWKLRTSVPSANPVGGITSNGRGRWVAVGGAGVDGEIHYSRDAGYSWHSATIPSGTFTLTEVMYINGSFVAMGNSGATLRSTDGINWQSQTISGANTIRTMEQVGSMYYAGGDGVTLIYSSDGVNWQSASTLPAIAVYDIAGNDSNNLVICGIAGDNANYSIDYGVNWQAPSSPAANGQNGAAYLNGVFYCGGIDGDVRRSLDGGVNWSGAIITHGHVIGDMLSTNGLLIAVAQNGRIFSTTDGSSWTTHIVDSSNFTDVRAFSDRLLFNFQSSIPADQD